MQFPANLKIATASRNSDNTFCVTFYDVLNCQYKIIDSTQKPEKECIQADCLLLAEMLDTYLEEIKRMIRYGFMSHIDYNDSFELLHTCKVALSGSKSIYEHFTGCPPFTPNMILQAIQYIEQTLQVIDSAKVIHLANWVTELKVLILDISKQCIKKYY